MDRFWQGCGDEPALARCKELAAESLADADEVLSMLDQIEATPSDSVAIENFKDFSIDFKQLTDTLWGEWTGILNA